MTTNWKAWLMLLMIVFANTGCGQIRAVNELRQAAATREAERYPWKVYPISEDTKAALCTALDLPSDNEICQKGTRVMHRDILNIIERLFPTKETSYSEVEAKLGGFPYKEEESLDSNGNLISLRYIYRLTEYEGACIYFYLDLDDRNTVTRIGATEAGSTSGPTPTKCGPSE